MSFYNKHNKLPQNNKPNKRKLNTSSSTADFQCICGNKSKFDKCFKCEISHGIINFVDQVLQKHYSANDCSIKKYKNLTHSFIENNNHFNELAIMYECKECGHTSIHRPFTYNDISCEACGIKNMKLVKTTHQIVSRPTVAISSSPTNSETKETKDNSTIVEAFEDLHNYMNAIAKYCTSCKSLLGEHTIICCRECTIKNMTQDINDSRSHNSHLDFSDVIEYFKTNNLLYDYFLHSVPVKCKRCDYQFHDTLKAFYRQVVTCPRCSSG